MLDNENAEPAEDTEHTSEVMAFIFADNALENKQNISDFTNTARRTHELKRPTIKCFITHFKL